MKGLGSAKRRTICSSGTVNRSKWKHKKIFMLKERGVLWELNLGSLSILSKLKVNVILLTVMGVGIELDLGGIKLSGVTKRVNKKNNYALWVEAQHLFSFSVLPAFLGKALSPKCLRPSKESTLVYINFLIHWSSEKSIKPKGSNFYSIHIYLIFFKDSGLILPVLKSKFPIKI